MITQPAENGLIREFHGRERVYYDGYWLRYYPPPADNQKSKLALLNELTRRAFHHTEAGINAPGRSLNDARKAYEKATNSARRRVNAAMLAGALFNRATDLFRAIIKLEENGVVMADDSELLSECVSCYEEALHHGKEVRHVNGDEGIDELWGEPLKVFAMPMEDYYHSRYLKLALAMRNMDAIGAVMSERFAGLLPFAPLPASLKDFIDNAKQVAETKKIDRDIFNLWPKYVTSTDHIHALTADVLDADRLSSEQLLVLREGADLLLRGIKLIESIALVRVPMPRSKAQYLKALDDYFAGPAHKLSSTS